ncbi:hypothetical protein ASF82_13230 [Frigoribacterium sp. Leaf164]|uniref:CPBP family intramembrane glutamic endopeptidase n=1 Tax=Frigoribacterium sp. Leaf164 TaxID=1736282 RepID=UPI0006F1E06D|nr:CPBP family intramembrane glutamic endopeptidase [Frigoribacterium sp. Leaf164]KQR44408.1 hypothetical protein ASF82_13230 [Frigoribacterium sp. Leaf164]
MMLADLRSSCKAFWARGGLLPSLLAGGVYFAFLAACVAIARSLTSTWSMTAANAMLVGSVLPLAAGAAVLVIFARSADLAGALFRGQPLRGRRWMWGVVVVVAGFNVLHLLSVDYAAIGTDVLAMWVLTCVLVGLTEEVLCRGLIVNLLRRASYPEGAVAALSAGIFALLHAGNLVIGQAPLATGLQIVLAFGTGICFYLALRVTGNLIWPILLHTTFDLGVFLQTSWPASSPVSAVADAGNISIIVVGIVAFFFIRGQAAGPASLPAASPRAVDSV